MRTGTRATPVGSRWRTAWLYDGLGRARIRIDYTWTTTWTVSAEAFYVYDGMRVIQERSSSNVPTVSYTRGNDLSGSLEGAGGIGGLLGRSHGYSSGTWSTHNHYHADGNGNVTFLVNSSQTAEAWYRYDPYGRTMAQSATALTTANVYRFSSKEIHAQSGMYYYGFRFYDPHLQRWPNRDPIGEEKGVNLYAFVGNASLGAVDPLGLRKWIVFPLPVSPFLVPVPTENPEACARRIAETIRTSDFRIPGDWSNRYSHCLASCRITQECPGGRLTAWIAGDWVRDPWWKGEKQGSEAWDRVANKIGRDAACDTSKSCEEHCSEAYKQGRFYPPPSQPWYPMQFFHP